MNSMSVWRIVSGRKRVYRSNRKKKKKPSSDFLGSVKKYLGAAGIKGKR